MEKKKKNVIVIRQTEKQLLLKVRSQKTNFNILHSVASQLNVFFLYKFEMF